MGRHREPAAYSRGNDNRNRVDHLAFRRLPYIYCSPTSTLNSTLLLISCPNYVLCFFHILENWATSVFTMLLCL